MTSTGVQSQMKRLSRWIWPAYPTPEVTFIRDECSQPALAGALPCMPCAVEPPPPDHHAAPPTRSFLLEQKLSRILKTVTKLTRHGHSQFSSDSSPRLENHFCVENNLVKTSVFTEFWFLNAGAGRATLQRRLHTQEFRNR